jgi:uncharacterized delta-60 repeat protein
MRYAVLAAAVLALLSVQPVAAGAAAGDLDASFGGSGTVTTDFGLGAEESVQDVAIDASGRVVAVGSAHLEGFASSVAVARYTASGSLDPTFGGGDGLVLMHFDGGTWDSAAAVAVDSSGRIVVGGSTSSDLSCEGFCDFAVTRLTASGSLDPTFGGDGTVTADIGEFDFLTALTIDSSGRIIVGGGGDGDFVLLRYTPTGAPDPSFDGNGLLLTDFGESYDYVAGLALDGNGRIVASGYSSYSSADFATARYLANGELDPSFSGDGRVVTDLFSFEGQHSLDFLEAVGVDMHNRIVAVGSSVSPGESEGHLTIVRYTPSGALDWPFGIDGEVSAGTRSSARDVAIDASGRLLVTGYLASLTGDEAMLIRYLSDGSLDATFGGGDAVASVPYFADSVGLDAAQRIIVGGSDFLADSDFAVSRYLGDTAAQSPAPPSSSASAAQSPPSTPIRSGGNSGPSASCRYARQRVAALSRALRRARRASDRRRIRRNLRTAQSHVRSFC